MMPAALPFSSYRVQLSPEKPNLLVWMAVPTPALTERTNSSPCSSSSTCHIYLFAQMFTLFGLWSSVYCCHKTCGSRFFSTSQLLCLALKPHIPIAVNLFLGWSSRWVGCFPATRTFPSHPLPAKHMHIHTFLKPPV